MNREPAIAAIPRIVAFTKDWDDVPTCTTHVLREMGKTMPVLWIESIGMRKPQVRHSRDMGRMIRRLFAGFRRAELKENRLRVLTPLVVPKAQSWSAQRLNSVVMGWLIRRELRGMGDPSTGLRADGPVEYWCFVPNAADLLPRVRSQSQVSGFRFQASRPKVVYYCVDDWSKYAQFDVEWLEAEERLILARADVVFTPSRCLAEKCRLRAAGSVHYVPHGVDYAKFSRALDEGLPVPEDMANLPRPIVGFYGNLYPWIDFDLLEELALRRPGWTFAVIGHPYCDVSRLESLPNVHLLGRREHDELPACCKAFGAAIIPYDIANSRMASVNPVKTKELLAAGVPIVAADVPELRGMGDDVLICRGAEEWVAALEKQMVRKDRREISARVAGEDWSVKVGRMRRIVEKIANSE